MSARARSRAEPRLPEQLALPALERAQRLSAGTVLRTPLLTAGSLSAPLGARLALKAESLQRTGSFKLRGALNGLRGAGGGGGVVAGSAGNHAQALAYAARTMGVGCEIFMPLDAPASKLAAVRAFGATVHHLGESVDESIELAREHAAERKLRFVHPFDDLDVIAGQAGVALELLEQERELGTIVVPVGGGGLICGVAAAVRQRRPHVRIVGVQAERCAPVHASLAAGHVVSAESASTIADGIAVKRPGEITLPLIEQLVDELVTVADGEIAEAISVLLERAKLVVEGAGAAPLAAAISGRVELGSDGVTAIVLSGGNIDVGLLATIAGRHETLEGRRLRLFTQIRDRPGAMAQLLATVAETKANLLAVEHVRDSARLDVGETGVELTLQTRGREHSEAVRQALSAAGYDAADA